MSCVLEYEEDELIFLEDYEDVTLELSASGFNLTSVISSLKDIESQYEEADLTLASSSSGGFDPISYYFSSFFPANPSVSSITSTSPLPQGVSSTRITNHPSGLMSIGNSNYSSHSSSFLSISSSHHALTSSTSLTRMELNELQLFLLKMDQVSKVYCSVHSLLELRKESLLKLLPTSSSANLSSVDQSNSAEILKRCYQEVPSVFLRQDFNLANQEHFNQALLSSTLSATSSYQNSSKSFTDIAYKSQSNSLSYYFDLIEVTLLTEISNKAPQFFVSLGLIEKLKESIESSLKLIKNLNKKLKEFESPYNNFYISNLLIKKKNYALLIEKLYEVKLISYIYHFIFELFSHLNRQNNGELIEEKIKEKESNFRFHDSFFSMDLPSSYIILYNLLSFSQDFFHEKNLQRINVMNSLLKNFSQLQNNIEEVLIASLDKKIVGFSFQCSSLQVLQDAKNSLTVILLESNTTSSSVNSTSSFSDVDLLEFLQTVQVLNKNRKLMIFFNFHLQSLIHAVRLIIRTCILEYMHDFDDENNDEGQLDPASIAEGSSATYTQKLKDMAPDIYLSCLSMCYEQLNMNIKKTKSFFYLFFFFFSYILTRKRQLKNYNEVLSFFSSSSTTPVSATSSSTTSSQFSNDNIEGSYSSNYFSNPIQSISSLLISSIPSLSYISSPPTSPHPPPPSSSSSSSLFNPIKIKKLYFKDKNVVELINLFHYILTKYLELIQKQMNHVITLKKDTILNLNINNFYFFIQQYYYFLNNIEISIKFDVFLCDSDDCNEDMEENVNNFNDEVNSIKSENSNSLSSYNFSFTATLLRQTVNQHIKLYLNNLHEDMKHKLINALDFERWVQVDITSERQKSIDLLLEGKIISESVVSSSSPVSPNSSSATPIKKSKELKPIYISNEPFKIVWSLLYLIEVTMNYLELSYLIPSITMEIILKLIDIIKLFNSRTKQLVLGAQSIQSQAKLKSISAKHLAFTLQSISFYTNLIPHIKSFFLTQINRSAINPCHDFVITKNKGSEECSDEKSQTDTQGPKLSKSCLIYLTEFDRQGQDLIDHINQILNKFLSIVNDMLDTSSAKLKNFNFDLKSNSNCEYFEDINKNICTLYKVLLNILPQNMLHKIFTSIYALLNNKILQHIKTYIKINTLTGKKKLLDEINLLFLSLIQLKIGDSNLLNNSDKKDLEIDSDKENYYNSNLELEVAKYFGLIDESEKKESQPENQPESQFVDSL